MELQPNQKEQKLNILKSEIEGVTSEHITISSHIIKKK